MKSEWQYDGERWVRTTRTAALLVIEENTDDFSYRYTGGYAIPGDDGRVDPVTSGSVAEYVRGELEMWAAKHGIIDATDITSELVGLPS